MLLLTGLFFATLSLTSCWLCPADCLRFATRSLNKEVTTQDSSPLAAARLFGVGSERWRPRGRHLSLPTPNGLRSATGAEESTGGDLSSYLKNKRKGAVHMGEDFDELAAKDLRSLDA